MSRSWEPHDWSPERLTFSAYKLIALVVASRRTPVEGQPYDQIVLVRKPGRNGFETYSLSWIHAALHLALAAWLLHAAGLPAIAQVVLLPPLVLVVAFVVAVGSCVVGAGFVALTGAPVNQLRLSSLLNTLSHSAVALFLLTRDHWTRYAAAGWLALLALNGLAFLIRLPLRKQFSALSERMGRESQFAD